LCNGSRHGMEFFRLKVHYVQIINRSAKRIVPG
jgi:hypothetical protein